MNQKILTCNHCHKKFVCRPGAYCHGESKFTCFCDPCWGKWGFIADACHTKYVDELPQKPRIKGTLIGERLLQ